jgi:hypothetical protein
MKKIQLLFSAAAILLLGACSSYKYSSYTSERADFSNYHTYAWVPSNDRNTTKAYNNDFAEEKIVDAASQQLNQRGFQLDNSKPDLLIKYTALVNNKTRTTSNPVYYRQQSYYVPRVAYSRGRAVYYYQYVDPFPVYVGSQIRKETFEEGNVMIDVIDRKTSKVIWRGIAKGEVDNPEKAIDDIPKVVEKIFGKFPK